MPNDTENENEKTLTELEQTLSDETLKGDILNSFNAILNGIRDGISVGSKEMVYLYILVVLQIGMDLLNDMVPAEEWAPIWAGLFMIFKWAVRLGYLLWGGMMKKQVQDYITAKNMESNQLVRDYETESKVTKTALNDAAVQNQKTELKYKIKEYDASRAEREREEMYLDKKKWKQLYYDLKGSAPDPTP